MYIRPARWEDARFLFNLKNDATVRANSLVTHDEISWGTHIGWLHKHLNEIHIIEFNGVPCGDVRVEGGEVAIKLLPDYRGLGIGRVAIEWAKKRYGKLTAKVALHNRPSVGLFERCGFGLVSVEDDYYVFEYKPQGEA